MKKSFSVNISGVIFQVDEDAYEKLHRYLDRLNLHFANTEGKDEIIADIEQRIAEMLTQKLGDHRVVTLAHIEEVVSALGEPVDFEDGTTEEPILRGRRYRRRLYRDPDDKVLGGVAGGMGSYFNTDPLWFRIAFIVLTIFGGSGILVYLILWLIIPEARTAAERLEMRGEEININNIERTIKEEMADIRRRFGDWKQEGGRKKKDEARRVISSGGQILGTLLLVAFRLVAGLVGLALFAVVFMLIFSLVVPGISLHGFPMLYGISVHEALMVATGSPGTAWMVLTAVLVILLLPLFGLLWAGIRLLFNIRKGSRWAGRAFSAIWGLAILFLVVASVITVNDFSTKGHLDDSIVTLPISSDTLTIGMVPITSPDLFLLDDRASEFMSMYITRTREGILMAGKPVIRFKQSHDENTMVSTTRHARGSSHRVATERASALEHTIKTDSTLIDINHLFTLPHNAHYRDQGLVVTIYLPEGRVFLLDPFMRQRYHQIEDMQPLWDKNMPNKYLMMKNNALVVAE